MQVQVKVNETGVLRNQRHAFTDRFTLLTELLQNARRAGATRITVNYDHTQRLLHVSDDGHGIEDFQKLLTFHESGWGEDLAARENPFGIGFSKCLYAASRCIVTSGDYRVDIDTESALQRSPVDVQVNPTRIVGTNIELHGVDLAGIESHVDRLCMGFPIEVAFNGREVPRPFALANLDALRTPIGTIYLCCSRDGLCATQTVVFLQGFCVKRPVYFDFNAVNVVHLDPKQFMARLPDRDTLIDEDQQLQKIEVQLKSAWHQRLKTAKSELPPERFVSMYYDAMRHYGALALLNDMDVLPRRLFERIVGYPIQAEPSEQRFLQELSVPPTRHAVESGRVKLAVLESLDEENAACWMFAWRENYLVVHSYGLDIDHWVHAYITDMSDQKVVVEPLSPTAKTTLHGRWVWPGITLCQSIRIEVGNTSVDIDDAGVCHDGELYIPARESSGEPVRQLSSFTDEHDHFEQDALDADREELATLIRRLRCVDPVDTLNSLLNDAALGRYAVLHGKRFEVSIEMPMQDIRQDVESTKAAAPPHHVRLMPLNSDGTTSTGEESVVLEVRHALS